jgi:predicted MFS family arabinose efflux permease
VSGVATGAVTWRADNATRFRWGLVALAVSVVPLPFLEGLALMGAVLFVAGFAISPTLIALMALTEEVVPIARLTEGMSIIHTGMAAGIAPGAALAGLVVDRAGASSSYWVPVASGVVGAAAAFIAAAAAHRRGAAGRDRSGEASSPTGSSS